MCRALNWWNVADKEDGIGGPDALLLALAAGMSVRDAAAAAGVSESTVYRRMRDPQYRQEVQAVRGEMMSQALGAMADGMAEAAGVLRGLLRSNNEGIKLSAARSMLDLGVKIQSAVEIEQRLTAIEARIHGQESGARKL